MWKDGSVAGDEFGERDTRFAYILVSALSLLGRLGNLEALYDGKGRELVIDNFVRSMNYDGAFGAEPGAESHGAQGMFIILVIPIALPHLLSSPPPTSWDGGAASCFQATCYS